MRINIADARGRVPGMEELFQTIGLSETKARETAKNISVSNLLKSYILKVSTKSRN